MGRGVRWPLRELVVVTTDTKLISAIENLKEIIKTQVNVKSVSILPSLPGVKQTVKPDYEKLQPTFGDDAPIVIANLAINAPASILRHLETHEKYVLKVNNKEYSIVKEHLIVQREVPAKYEEAVSGAAWVYLDKTVDDELEGEGYAREVMRRIQAARKKAGLQKRQNISLFIKVDEKLKNYLSKWEAAIKEKVGAEVIHIGTGESAREHMHKGADKVKGKEFSFGFDVV